MQFLTIFLSYSKKLNKNTNISYNKQDIRRKNFYICGACYFGKRVKSSLQFDEIAMRQRQW